MGLVDKLTELDEKIWKQYEKITQYCNKEYGWDKYDLARKTYALEWGASVGWGSYMAIYGLAMDSVASIVVGGLVSLTSIPLYHFNKQRSDDLESVECKLLEDTGTVRQPLFKPQRPPWFGLSTYWIGMGLYTLINGREVPEQIPVNADEYNLLRGMIEVAASVYLFAQVSAKYFEDQIFNGPTKKKGFFKTMYEKVTGKLQPAVPQLEPVKSTKYQSIDEVVGE